MQCSWAIRCLTQIARFVGPTWAHLGPVVPRWAPYWPHKPCYQGISRAHKVSEHDIQLPPCYSLEWCMVSIQGGIPMLGTVHLLCDKPQGLGIGLGIYYSQEYLVFIENPGRIKTRSTATTQIGHLADKSHHDNIISVWFCICICFDPHWIRTRGLAGEEQIINIPVLVSDKMQWSHYMLEWCNWW